MSRSANIKAVCKQSLCMAVLFTLPAASPAADNYEGFTEPYRTINVAAVESGIIAELLVREGERVQAGQPLARLDSKVQQALLAIAKQRMQAVGQLDAAVSELHLRRERLEKLESLRNEGHARQEELERARSEVEVAQAHVLTAREDLLNRKLEHEKFKVQLERRTVLAPVTGVVTKLHKQMGEFVAPNNPDVLTVVELDPLLANFTINSAQVAALHVEQQLPVVFPASGLETTGVVELIAPVTDAESGTVRIKLRVDNPDGRFRSGERCQIRLAD